MFLTKAGNLGVFVVTVSGTVNVFVSVSVFVYVSVTLFVSLSVDPFDILNNFCFHDYDQMSNVNS